MIALILAAALISAPGPETFHGRGVYHLVGTFPSPLSGVGSRAPNEAIRIVLDDDHTTAEVNRSTGRILLTNVRPYAKEQIVGDVMFLGVGTSEEGSEVPVAVHLEVRKKGDKFSTSAHQHPVVPGKVGGVRLEPFSVVLRSEGAETLAFTPEQAAQVIQSPGIGFRLASLLFQAARNPSKDPIVLADVTFSVGLGALSKELLRVRVLSQGGIPAAGTSVADLMRQPWEIQLIAQSDLPASEFQRDFFLVGLDGVPLLQPMLREGLGRGNAMVIRHRAGRGFVFYGGKWAELPQVLNVARAYMEYTGVGFLVSHQVRLRLEGR